MKVVVQPPLCAGSETVRAVVAIDIDAQDLPHRAIGARAALCPVAIVVGVGDAARLLTLDGRPADLRRFGLTRADIA